MEQEFPIKFITVHEKNTKENEEFLYNCYLNGDDKTQDQLKKLIEKADYDKFYGDEYISLAIDMTPLPEFIVDIHKKNIPTHK